MSVLQIKTYMNCGNGYCAVSSGTVASDYNSVVSNSTYGRLRVHSECMWCVKWTPDDRLVEWGREGGRNTGFSCVWARVGRDSAPTLFHVLLHCTALHFVYITAAFGEMGQGRSVTN
jgi:hypothetical protein